MALPRLTRMVRTARVTVMTIRGKEGPVAALRLLSAVIVTGPADVPGRGARMSTVPGCCS